MVESSAQDLTSTNYWETFWSDGHRPSTIHKSGLRNHVQDTFLGVLAPLIEATGPRPRWIEAGCAYSKYLTALPDKFDIEMHGLDYESAALEATRAELDAAGAKPVTLHCRDFRDIGDLEGTFDGVFSAGLVEHFTDTVGVHRDLARLVRPGGYVVSFIPNMNGVNGMLQLLASEEIFRSHHVLGIEALGQSMTMAGLELLHCEPIVSIDLAVANFGRRNAARLRHGVERGLFGMSALVWAVERTTKRSLPPKLWRSGFIVAVGRRPG